VATRKMSKRAAPGDAVAEPSDGVVTSAMKRHAEMLRAEQGAPFREDSADLIRESRRQRHGRGRDQSHTW
jgi:hypothetical protein